MSPKTAGTGERTATLDVALLGRDYKIACREGEQAELTDAVAFLETRMREIRDAGKSSSVERIAVMAALNLAHDLQRERATPPVAPVAPESIDVPALQRRIVGMQSVIDKVLPDTEKLL